MNFLHNLFGKKVDAREQTPIQEDTPGKPDSAEIGRWVEGWLKEGGSASSAHCWNCRWFTIPLSGAHDCTKASSQVDCLGHCKLWDACTSA